MVRCFDGLRTGVLTTGERVRCGRPAKLILSARSRALSLVEGGVSKDELDFG